MFECAARSVTYDLESRSSITTNPRRTTTSTFTSDRIVFVSNSLKHIALLPSSPHIHGPRQTSQAKISFPYTYSIEHKSSQVNANGITKRKATQNPISSQSSLYNSAHSLGDMDLSSNRNSSIDFTSYENGD